MDNIKKLACWSLGICSTVVLFVCKGSPDQTLQKLLWLFGMKGWTWKVIVNQMPIRLGNYILVQTCCFFRVMYCLTDFFKGYWATGLESLLDKALSLHHLLTCLFISPAKFVQAYSAYGVQIVHTHKVYCVCSGIIWLTTIYTTRYVWTYFAWEISEET